MDSISVNIENNSSKCIAFAADELKKYLKSHGTKELRGIARINLKRATAADNINDSFAIEINDEQVILTGANERSVLFAVYTFLREYCGLRFLHVDRQSAVNCVNPQKINNGIRKYKPAFSSRGIYMENTELQLEFIDWMAKNKMNCAIISLQSWWSMEEEIIAEIEKRDLILALGGHSYLDFLKPKTYFHKHSEWYAEIDGARVEYGQICFANQAGKQKLFENLYDYLKKLPAIKRLALSPVDNKHYCQCSYCRGKIFLELNCELMSELNRYLQDEGLDVTVEHLAYNASLSQEMFKVPESIENNLKIATRLAYWGRNYNETISESPIKTDKNAWAEIKAWSKTCQIAGQELRIIEYYTDFWMMTTLFPLLGKVISKDMAHYKALPVDKISSLVVQPQVHGYPWHKYVEFNIYVFAEYCWNTEYDFNEIMDDYFNARFGDAATLLKSYYGIVQDSLPALTGFNIPLFRMRFTDIWHRDESPSDGGTRFVPAQWRPETVYSTFDRKRWKFTTFLYDKTRSIDIEKISFENLSIQERNEVNDAIEYLSYIKARIKSLYIQQKAQRAIVKKAWAEARAFLVEALELEENCYKEDSNYCRKWLENTTALIRQ